MHQRRIVSAVNWIKKERQAVAITAYTRHDAMQRRTVRVIGPDLDDIADVDHRGAGN